MNEARRQSARPGDFGAKKGAPKMPPEVRAMARQMGIPAEELAGADGMWQKLTEMSEKDPAGYADLLGESAKHVAKSRGEELAEGMEPDEEKATALMTKLLSPDSMTPTAGYVVKCALKYGGGKLMVNCCAHAAVQPPKDAAGRDATDRDASISAQGLSIPMVVGEPRSCAVAGAANGVGSGHAIDVVFHPWVLERCAAEGPKSPFKADVSALAVRWVAQESKLAVDTASWKHISSTYKGGTGERGDGVVPFPLDEAKFQDAPPDQRGARKTAAPTNVKPAKNPTGVATSPESLLQRARAIATEAEKAKEIDLKTTSTKAKKKKVMIQEVGADGEVLEATTDGFDISGGDDAEPAVKKGFLDSASAKNKALYPESGSAQGDSQKEGAYSRFMSKCKVVDTTQMSKEEQDAMMKKHAEGDLGKQTQQPQAPKAPKAPKAPPPDPSKSFDAVKKGFLGDSKSEDLYAKDEAKSRKREAVADPLFDELSSALDPEFMSANRAATAPPDDEDDTVNQLREFADKMDFGQMFGGFGKPKAKEEVALAPVEPPPPKVPGSRVQEPEEIPRGFIEAAAVEAEKRAAERAAKPKPFTYATETLAPAPSGKRRARVVVKLDGVASFADVDLDVRRSTMRLRHETRSLGVSLPFAADPAAAAAKFSKKKAQLTVTLTEA